MPEPAQNHNQFAYSVSEISFVRRLASVLGLFLAYLVLCVSCFLMLRSIVGYTSFRDNEQFLLMKQDYIHNTFWKSAFYIHVFTAIVALFAGFTQFSKDFLKEARPLHRVVGKIYVYVILVVNVPVGFVMGIYANGGLLGKSAFLLLDGLWFCFTYKAFAYAKKKNFVRHRQYMIRSYALTFSAITLRTWKLVLSHYTDIDLASMYIIDAWLGFVPNMLIAESIIRFYGKSSSKISARIS